MNVTAADIAGAFARTGLAPVRSRWFGMHTPPVSGPACGCALTALIVDRLGPDRGWLAVHDAVHRGITVRDSATAAGVTLDAAMALSSACVIGEMALVLDSPPAPLIGLLAGWDGLGRNVGDPAEAPWYEVGAAAWDMLAPTPEAAP